MQKVTRKQACKIICEKVLGWQLQGIYWVNSDGIKVELSGRAHFRSGNGMLRLLEKIDKPCWMNKSEFDGFFFSIADGHTHSAPTLPEAVFSAVCDMLYLEVIDGGD